VRLPGAILICLLFAACGGEELEAPAPAPVQPPVQVVERAQTELPPLPEKSRATVVEPSAGTASGAAGDASSALAAEPPPTDAPKPTRAASEGLTASRPPSAGDGVDEATALPNGIALPPLEAPEAVRQMIEAGNQIARTPYLWGGGHGKWVDSGYDCSGSVSFVLASAGFLSSPLASGPLMSWGEPGPGKWVTIYSNPGHVYMVVAGIRFDTSGRQVSGSRWQNELRTNVGFVARHPPGL
jgi:cell wall-associated NlpC family hydrolase